MLSELKAFLFRGDVISLAIAVIIAGAFGKIVDSLVADIITPIIGMLTGGINFAESFKIGSGEAQIKLGAFFQAIINFVTIGIVLYFLVKSAGKQTEEIK